MASRPKTAVQWRGHWFDPETRDMLVELDKLVGPYVPIEPTQGSYSTSFDASAGTHSGPGAVDLSTRKLTAFQKSLVVFLARRIGFAAWLRTAAEGPWAEHIHMINKSAKGLPAGAASQVTKYSRGLSGLASGRADAQKALEAPYESTWKSYRANWPSR